MYEEIWRQNSYFELDDFRKPKQFHWTSTLENKNLILRVGVFTSGLLMRLMIKDTVTHLRYRFFIQNNFLTLTAPAQNLNLVLVTDTPVYSQPAAFFWTTYLLESILWLSHFSSSHLSEESRLCVVTSLVVWVGGAKNSLKLCMEHI